jgi:hypothetical protein
MIRDWVAGGCPGWADGPDVSAEGASQRCQQKGEAETREARNLDVRLAAGLRRPGREGHRQAGLVGGGLRAMGAFMESFTRDRRR